MGRNKQVIVIAVVMLLCILPGLGHAADELFDTEAATTLAQKGIEDLRAGRYDAAIEAFEESVNINPEAPAFYYLGYAYYMKGKKSNGENRVKAMENFDKAYELDPNFTPMNISTDEPAAEAPAPVVPQLN
jgi:tetratricopeptide (TPR) repeat protein